MTTGTGANDIRRPCIVVIGLTVLAIILVWLASWHTYATLRDERFAAMDERARQVLLSFETHAVRLFDYGDTYLRSARHLLQEDGATETLRTHLAAISAPHSSAFSGIVTIADASGRIIFVSNSRHLPDVNVGDLPHFVHLRDHPGDGLILDPTRRGRVTGEFQYRLTRPILRNGHFDGEIVLTLRPEHLIEFYRDQSLGPRSVSEMMSLDLRLLARQPEHGTDHYGHPIPGLRLWQEGGEIPSSGIARHASPIDGVTRTYYYRKLADYDAIVALGICDDDVFDSLRPARRAIALVAAIVSLAALIVCVLMLRLLRDLAERRAKEAALTTSAHLMAEVERISSVGGWELDMAAGRLLLSQGFMGIHGIDRSTLSLDELLPLAHPDDRPRITAAFEAARAAGQPYDIEHRIIRQDNGAVRVVRAHGEMVADGQDAMLRMVGASQDVTDFRQAEHSLQRLNKILRAMSEGNQVLVRAATEVELFTSMCDVIVEHGGYRMAWIGLAEHDEEHTIRPVAVAGQEDGYLSQARIGWGENPFGNGPSGLAIRSGMPQINDDFAANPLVVPWRDAALERGYRASIALPLVNEGFPFGVLTIYAGEANCFGDEEVKLLVELANDVAYGLVTLRTRREHRELEQTLLQVQKMEALGQLTGGIAHDFNNLLQVILSNLDLSLNRLDGGAEVAGYLQNAIAGAEQGAKLTGQLLAFARRQPLRPEPLRIDRLVGDMTSLLRRTLGEQITVEMVTSGGLWTAMVDPNQLRNAILNLAINARDAMPEGGKLTVELANASLDTAYAAGHREVKAGQYVMLAVTDTGCGMSPDVLGKVFEPFFTTKAEGSGTGLGLSMVYGFVKQSGGHVKMYSEVGVGTTVRVYLPRTQQSETLRLEEKAKAARGSGETILVAEDDDGVRASVVTQLAELGYRVLAAANGEAALDLLKGDEAINLLFTDVVMPGTLNGRALADQAKTCRPGLPVVFTSGYTENAIIHHGRLDPGVTLLSKPYRLIQLAETVRDTLHPAEAPPPPSPSPLAPATPARSSGHILVVDDEELIRGAVAQILQQYGYDVVEAATPSQALDILESSAPIDVLMTDFGLPEMNGLELARIARVRRPDLAIVLATGHNVDAGELQDVAVLLKPYHPAALRSTIEAVRSVAQGVG